MAAAGPLHIEAVRKGDRVIAYEVLQVDFARSDNDHYARDLLARFEVGPGCPEATRDLAVAYVTRLQAERLP